jgi:hypothetical protein
MVHSEERAIQKGHMLRSGFAQRLEFAIHERVLDFLKSRKNHCERYPKHAPEFSEYSQKSIGSQIHIGAKCSQHRYLLVNLRICDGTSLCGWTWE